MSRLMSKEESFAERRKLFKEIWASTMGEAHNRPKIIKTLYLDEIDRSKGKRKKQKVRNLRNVCHKLLEYCDHQEENCLSSPESENQSRATYSGNDKIKPKPRKQSKSKNFKSPKPVTGTKRGQ